MHLLNLYVLPSGKIEAGEAVETIEEARKKAVIAKLPHETICVFTEGSKITQTALVRKDS